METTINSSWDFIRTVLVDPELDSRSVYQIFQSMVQETDAFTRELIELTDEELKARVAELMGMSYELQQPSLVPVVNWLFSQTMSFRDSDQYYIEFIFSNNLLPEEVLTFIVKSDPKLSISETLVLLIKNNIYGSRQYAFERIYPFIDDSRLSRACLSTCMELARSIGDEEGLGFMKRVYQSRYSTDIEKLVRPNVTSDFYARMKAEECRILARYQTMLNKLLAMDNAPLRDMTRGRQMEVKTLLEKVSGMKEMDEGAFDELCKEGLLGLKQVRYVELLNWIETNQVLKKLYGPYNPDRVIRSSVFGRLSGQLPEFPADPRKFFMHYYDPEYDDDWFVGICDHCQRQIPVRQKAFRTPLADGGGWEGCFCSSTCSFKHLLSSTEYSIPLEDLDEKLDLVHKQMTAFLNSQGFGYLEGLGFLVREFPVLFTNTAGETEDGRSMRLPKIVVVPAREEKIKENVTQDLDYQSIIETGESVLRELGLNPDDFGLLKDEGETIRYHKEVVLKRDHIETYALTMLMNRIFESEVLIIPPKLI
jgi:hypothetical protein